MRRIRLLLVFTIMALLVVACGGPKDEAKKLVNRFPAAINDLNREDAQWWQSPIPIWELTDDRTVLSIETQSNYGYATISYEGNDERFDLEDITAYITVWVHANESAADVALESMLLDWQLQGLRFDSIRFGASTFDAAALEGGNLYLHQNEDIVIEIRIIPEEIGKEIPEAAAERVLETILRVLRNAD